MAQKWLDTTALVLIIVGGLNWGLAVFDLNLVNLLLGSIPYAEKIVYALVGIAAIYEITKIKK